jgi:xanthine dehydrogenase accessory factor
MLVHPDGMIEGTVGGGLLEREAIAEGSRCLASGQTHSCTYELRADGERALGTLCGGEVTVLYEPHAPARRIVIVGGGHIGRELAALAATLDFGVTVLDARADMVARERFPEGVELVCADPADVTERCGVDERTSVVIVAPTADEDERALRATIDSRAGYLGMIGSTRKIQAVYERLKLDGVSEEALARVHAPIGLDIGAETPAELALCIMAEIVAVERGKLGDAGPAVKRPAASADPEA